MGQSRRGVPWARSAIIDRRRISSRQRCVASSSACLQAARRAPQSATRVAVSDTDAVIGEAVSISASAASHELHEDDCGTLAVSTHRRCRSRADANSGSTAGSSQRSFITRLHSLPQLLAAMSAEASTSAQSIHLAVVIHGAFAGDAGPPLTRQGCGAKCNMSRRSRRNCGAGHEARTRSTSRRIPRAPSTSGRSRCVDRRRTRTASSRSCSPRPTSRR